MKWQPIATAPTLDQNNEPVLLLLYCPHSMGGYIFVGCCYNDKWVDNLNAWTDHKPTHWKWLDKPPTA